MDLGLSGEIQCDSSVTGNVERSTDVASWDFFNPVDQVITLTNCETDLDAQMRLYDANGQDITDTGCGGDETFIFDTLDAGKYTIKINPVSSGGDYVIKIYCASTDATIPDVANDIVGVYNGQGESGEARISRTTGNQIKVDMSPRPIATGVYNPPGPGGAYGTGYVDFPDDKRYNLFFYPDEGTIYWDDFRGRTANFWMEQDIIGCYGTATIRRTAVGTENIQVAIPGRPVANGVYDKDTLSGEVDFTDDKEYDFQFDTTKGKIDWGDFSNGLDNNIWTKTQPDIVGVYGQLPRFAVIRRAENNVIKVDMSSANRPEASGIVNCPSELGKPFTGHVTFPDDRRYDLYFYPGDAKIYWGGDKGHTTNIWTKFGDSDSHAAHSFSNINLDWIDPKKGAFGYNYNYNDGDNNNDQFKIITNNNGYITFELLIALIFILMSINIGCCYINYTNNKKASKGYKAVSYVTDTEA